MLHHEFWPSQILYVPVFFVYLKNAIKLRALNFFCWTNPHMENGGLIGYSKYKMLDLVPEKQRPPTLYIYNEDNFPDVELKVLEDKFEYPFIAKPDKGARGYRVQFIENTNQFRRYHKTAKQPYLVQEFIDYKMEYGVFVVRTDKDFIVSSLVQKEFLALVGDGKSTLESLFDKHPRALKYYKKTDLPAYLDRILIENKVLLLEPIGNHCRGTKFVDANLEIDEALKATFKKLVLSLPEFYYGRFDVKAESLEALKKGEFKVLEVNGISAEPGHIYDPRCSTEKAYKDLFWHWQKMAEIAEINRTKGFQKESLLRTLISLLDYYRNR